MGKSCSAVGCANRFKSGSGVKFYRFPSEASEKERRQRWICAVSRKNWRPGKHSWICSEHFVGGSKSDDPLSPAYIPSIFSFLSSPVKRQLLRKQADYVRRKGRCLRLSEPRQPVVEPTLQPVVEPTLQPVVEPCQQPSVEEAVEQDCAVQSTDVSFSSDASAMTPASKSAFIVERSAPSACCQTDIDMESMKDTELELMHLRTANEILKRRVEKLEEESDARKLAGTTLDERFLRGKDSIVLYYTGLSSYDLLMLVYKFVSKDMKLHHRSSLPLFSQVLLTLMKLRLSLDDLDLAFRFGVSQSTVSKIFARCIQHMHIKLKPLIRWPAREELRKTMPSDFRKHFNKCVCIIDCFEVLCERPRALMARAQTYSNYKSHNTTKFLIGIAPQGVITYISQAWGGRTSDKFITENCGILDNLLPGDQLMADRGFTVSDSVGLHCAELIIPPFTKGKKQLAQVEIDKSRELSRVRIHVERVIGCLRQKYKILQSILPISLLMHDSVEPDTCLLDQIVVVCCALCNTCESVVPFQ